MLVLEPAMADGSVKTWRKGVGDFSVTVRGKAAHAGIDHEKGRNAIEEMAHQVLAIQKMTDYSKETTLNVGVIHGGTVINVVPGEAVIQVDLRVMQPGEAERIIAELQALKPVLEGTTLEVSGELNRPPMPFDETMKRTFEKPKALPRQLASRSKPAAPAAHRMPISWLLWASLYWMGWARSGMALIPRGNSSIKIAWQNGPGWWKPSC